MLQLPSPESGGMVPRAMDKRGKDWTSLTEEQENTLVDLAVDQLGREFSKSKFLDCVCPARFDWSSVEVSLGGPFAGYRDDPRAGGEPPGLGRRGSIAESAVRSNSVVVMSPLLDQHLGLA